MARLHNSTLILSILIPTLRQRRAVFERLRRKLVLQIVDAGLQEDVEILSCEDRGEIPTGAKRNQLLNAASGRFVAHIDDDDAVHPRYVRLVVDALRGSPHVDCVGIRGVVTFRDRKPRLFEYSLHHKQYRTEECVYKRPPHHLNPIRREIATSYYFEPVWTAEDSDWAMRLSRDNALRREQFLDATLYYYYSRRWWPYQALLDHTEFFRHPLGIQLSNRHRLRRWARRHLSITADQTWRMGQGGSGTRPMNSRGDTFREGTLTRIVATSR